MPENFKLNAKIDTGADHSSIDAKEWTIFHRQGKEWIRFSVVSNGSNKIMIEKPLLRYSRVKRKRAKTVSRPVVQMDLCLAGIVMHTRVSLADRNNYKYRMLIGRSALKGHFLVDSSRTETSSPDCGQ
jgi:hypothetical protein